MTNKWFEMLEQEKQALRVNGKGLTALAINETPYQWQLNAIVAWRKTGRGTVIAPTACGKTLVALLVMQSEACPTLIITPTQAVLLRWYNELVERGASVGRFDGVKKEKGKDCDVAVINSVSMHPDIIAQYQLIIIDEIHHLAAEEYCKLLEFIQGKKVLGLTSTFERADGRHKIIELGVTTDYFNKDGSGATDSDFFGLLESTKRAIPVIFRYTLKEAASDGIIAPLTVTTKGVSLFCCNRFPHAESCEWKQYDEVSAEISKTYAQLGVKNLYDMKALGWRGQKLWGLISRRKMLLASAWNKAPVVLDIVSKESGKVLIFSESIESIQKLRSYLEQSKITCGMYHSKNKKASSVRGVTQRDADFEDWSEGKIQVLLSARALDEGINVPDVKLAIVIASGRANRQWTQRIGRILRKTGKTAQMYIIYCRNSIEQDYPSQVQKIMSGVVN